MSMDFEQARANMVEQQVRTWDVLDQRVLDAMSRVPREAFVPARYRMLAFADTSIPLGHGESMMAPRLEGRLLQALEPRAGDHALEIGTGSGYLTALLASLCRQVHSVDIYADFVADAGERLRARGCANVSLSVGDAREGWAAAGPCDLIAVTGSLPRLPDSLREQLRPGGRLFVVVGEGPAMEARLVTRVAERQWSTQTLFETRLAPLVGAVERPRFAV